MFELVEVLFVELPRLPQTRIDRFALRMNRFCNSLSRRGKLQSWGGTTTAWSAVREAMADGSGRSISWCLRLRGPASGWSVELGSGGTELAGCGFGHFPQLQFFCDIPVMF